MKVVIGIIIAALIAAIAAVLLLFVLRSHDLVLCGDVPQTNGNQMFVTRIYTYDVDANSTLSTIIEKMNSKTEGQLTAAEMTEILSEYQTVVYAPVFTYTLTQEGKDTYVLTGSAFNGLNEEGKESEDSDYTYKDLTLTIGVKDGKLLAAQNVYPDEEDVEDGEPPEFKERKKVVDPILVNNGAEAAFAFDECKSFRVVFTGKEDVPAEITLAYTFDVGAQNIFNFSGSKDNVLGVTIKGEYDDLGRLAPTIEMNRSIIEMETAEE